MKIKAKHGFTMSKGRKMKSVRGFVEAPPDARYVEGCKCWQCGAKEIMTFDRSELVMHCGFGCQKCGNKRCPHCEWHGFMCTGSNALDQNGEPL